MGLMKKISTSELLNLFGLQIRPEMATCRMKSITKSSCEIVSWIFQNYMQIKKPQQFLLVLEGGVYYWLIDSQKMRK
jgi:hypothetical protein